MTGWQVALYRERKVWLPTSDPKRAASLVQIIGKPAFWLKGDPNCLARARGLPARWMPGS